eukprot:TRINITY_DN8160_c0_g1_i3.p1 TRINITY_DN8160_c0_g1~~TRINITY_DN8160_c0_g1_i3.p1  ORF type:complete len:191 (-),score=28.55 TRINITY_DN8160_c0_g1_i3:188-760(-)
MCIRDRYLFYAFIHPWSVIVPSLFLLQRIVGTMVMKNYFSKLVTEVNLLDDFENVSFRIPYSKNQKEIVARVENVEVESITDIVGKNAGDGKNFVIIVNCVDLNDIVHDQLKIIVETQYTQIENADFLKCILNGEREELRLFKFGDKGATSEDVQTHETNQGENQAKQKEGWGGSHFCYIQHQRIGVVNT